jgi:ParB-like chromosome segregation protein Spo0J
VPCWVREMSDEDAYMALALNNAQGELHPLERGYHALGVVEAGKHGKRLGLMLNVLVERKRFAMSNAN